MITPTQSNWNGMLNTAVSTIITTKLKTTTNAITSVLNAILNAILHSILNTPDVVACNLKMLFFYKCLNRSSSSCYNIKKIYIFLRSRWRNGLVRLQQWPCYLQGPEFESHLLPVEFFACNKVSPLNNWTPTLTSVPCAPIN